MKSCSVLLGQPARRKAQAMLYLLSFIVWRSWSYLSCMVARLCVLTRLSSICWCCCCGAGWSGHRTSTQSSAMTKGFIKTDSKSTLTHFIMNHHEVLTMIQSCQVILTFLLNRGLLAARRRWNKGHSELDLFSNIQKSHCRTGSTSSSCGGLKSLIKKVSLLTGLSLRTVITALQRLQDICSLKIVHGNLKLGGSGKAIEMDESMFGHKREYNRWYGRERHWTSSGIPCTKQDKRNLGDWTSLEVHRAWNNNNLWQVFAILQPEQCRLHTPHG